MATEEYVKLSLLGERNSGKTTVCVRLGERRFGKWYGATSLDWVYHRLLVLPPPDGRRVRVHEPCGTEIFSLGSFPWRFFRQSHAFLLAFDVTSPASFTAATESWLPRVQQFLQNPEARCAGRELTPLVLVALKQDLLLPHATVRSGSPYRPSRAADWLACNSGRDYQKEGGGVAVLGLYAEASAKADTSQVWDVLETARAFWAFALLATRRGLPLPGGGLLVVVPELLGVVQEFVDLLGSPVLRGTVADLFLFVAGLVALPTETRPPKSSRWWCTIS